MSHCSAMIVLMISSVCSSHGLYYLPLLSDTFSQQIIAHFVFNIITKYQADIYRASVVFQEFDLLHPSSLITPIANYIFQINVFLF